MYESIIKGEPPQAPGTPESFKVLIKELQALGMNVELLKLGRHGKAAPSETKSVEKVEAA